MKNLSFTQEFFLCTLKPEGNIPLLKSTEISTCIVASGILELLFDEYIMIDAKKKIQAIKELEADKEYLEPLYNNIKSKANTVEGLAESYILGSNKRFKELFEALSNSLEKEGCVLLKDSNGLFHNKTVVIPDNDVTVGIIEKLRAEFLEAGTISEETIALGVLLYKSGLIKHYFSKFESDKLTERLNEVKKSETGLLVNKITDYIDTMIIIISSI